MFTELCDEFGAMGAKKEKAKPQPEAELIWLGKERKPCLRKSMNKVSLGWDHMDAHGSSLDLKIM